MNGDDPRDERETDPRTAADRDLSARLKHLEARIDRKREPAPERSDIKRRSSGPSALGTAFRMSSEFVAGVLAGGGLGWLFDRFVGTKPWGLIVFLMLGFAAGIYNVMRASGFAGRSSRTDG